MKEIELKGTKEKVPVIGIGTWQMKSDSEDSVNSIQASIENGSRFVDTAEAYRNEDMVGRAIKGYGDIFLATKVWPSRFRYDDVIKACENSLKKLGREQIDLYQLHWPNPKIDISETMKAMEKLADDGKIRYIGVSNFSVDQLKKAQSVMKNHEIVSNQVEYSILAREYEKGILPYCQDNSIMMIAYSPLGRGKFFTGKNKALPLIRKLADKYGKTPSQIGLNYIVSKKMVSVIPKTTNPEHAKQNLEAGNFSMSKEDLSRLEEELKSFNYRTMNQKFGWIISFALRLM